MEQGRTQQNQTVDRKKGLISVIIPAYNEAEGIDFAFSALSAVLRETGHPYELLFVNDGSSDDTWSFISSLVPEDPLCRVRGISFSRNFGKESAIFAGLDAVSGDACVVIDADLQHPPEKITEMVALWEEGYDVVEGIKEDRGKEGGLHRLFTSLFYGVISRSSGLALENTSDFKLLDRKVIDAIRSMPERNTFFRALSFWIGFRHTTVTYCVQERQFGTSKWSTLKLVKYAVDNITSFSAFPMMLVLLLAGLLFVVAVIMTIIALAQKFTGRALGGFTTVILLILFASSVIMGSIGIIGIYIAKIYEEVKARPRYIVGERYDRAPADRPAESGAAK